MAQVKGIALADAHQWIDEQVGGGAWQRVREALSPADRATLEAVVAIGWYPVDFLLRVLAVLPAATGREPAVAMAQYARFAVERHVSRVYRAVFLVADFGLILDKMGDHWSRFYDTGRWVIERESPKRVRAELVGFATPDPLLCEFLGNYAAELFSRVGAPGARFSHPRCRCRGEAGCVYLVEWR